MNGAVGTVIALGGAAAGAAGGYGMAKLIAAPTAESTAGYVGSQVGAGVAAGAIGAGAATVGTMMLFGGGFGNMPGVALAGVTVGLAGLALIGGSIAGMVSEHGRR